jgi:hypothetical protein
MVSSLFHHTPKARLAFILSLSVASVGTLIDACVSDGDSVDYVYGEGGAGDGSLASTTDGSTVSSDAGVAVDAAVKDAAEDGPFCMRSAASGPIFCADFESVTTAAMGWDSVTDGGVTLDTALGADSMRSGELRVQGALDEEATLTRTVQVASRAKVSLELDARFDFTGAWDALNDKVQFVTLTLSVGGANPYAIDIERKSDWMITAGGGVTQNIAVPADTAFHHLAFAYDGSGATAHLDLTMDGSSKASIALPGSAPSSFDTIAIAARVKVLNQSVPIAVHVDNVLCH